jgi:hypothetical protein
MKSLGASGSRYMGYQGIYPICEYSQMIGKNTAELTAADMAKFMVWWTKQPSRVEELMNMAKKYSTKKFQDAQTSRLAEQGIESPINDGEEEIIIHDLAVENEIVCTMELTRVDVEALLFAINRVCEDYEMDGHEYGASLVSLKVGLKGV